MALFELMEWDTNFFGFKVARLCEEAPEKLKQVQDICSEQDIRLLISRFSTNNVCFAHELERHGFQLMDTVVTYRLNLADARVANVPVPAIIRPCLKSEADELAAIARAVYASHIGHFHNDPRLDRDKCTTLYAELARNSCLDENQADIMLVAEMEGKIVGFHSHKVAHPNGLRGVISGVSHQAQGKGIGKALIVASANWGKSWGLEWIEEYPHVNHYRMHKMMADLGFRLCASFYTFHKWFDEVR